MDKRVLFAYCADTHTFAYASTHTCTCHLSAKDKKKVHLSGQRPPAAPTCKMGEELKAVKV